MKIGICSAEDPDVLAAVLRSVQSNSLLGAEFVILKTAEHDLSELVRVELVAELGCVSSQNGALKMDGKRHTAAVLAYHRMKGLPQVLVDSKVHEFSVDQDGEGRVISQVGLTF